jgi:hypothetical protein
MFTKLQDLIINSHDTRNTHKSAPAHTHTYRLNVELEHFLHVSGHLSEQHVGAIVSARVGHQYRPHGSGRHHRPPRLALRLARIRNIDILRI